MKSGLTGMVLIALFTNVLTYAQNDTPMEVLVNIANENERFIPHQIFKSDDRPSEYLDTYLSNFSLLTLDLNGLDKLVSEGGEYISLNLPAPNGDLIETKLVNHDIRAEGFVITDKLTSQEYEIPDAQYYRGVMKRGGDSQAGLSFFRNEVYGLLSSLQSGNIILAQDPIVPGDGSNYILYYEEDLLIDRDMECGADDLNPFKDDPTSATRNNVYSTCQDVEVLVEATKKLYDAKGSIASVSNYITAFFNNVSIIYRNESIYTSLKRINVNTSEGGYSSLTSAYDKLNKFGDETRDKYQQYGAELAHLVDVSPGLGGIAWIDVLCRDYNYYSTQGYHYGAYAYSSIESQASNFPDYSLTVFMFSHEMGHNLGSKHTQSCSWPGGAIDNCTTTEGGCAPGPAPISGGTIMSYCHNASYGINYSNGFGPLPGDKIRTLTHLKTCAEEYVPSGIVSTSPSKTITANRECTDKSGWTHYYFDNNTASESDDELLISVKKENENIGNLDDGTLVVQIKTSLKAGNGSTLIDNPGYDAGDDWHVMNRWFDILPTNEPSNPVSVKFPYTTADFADVTLNQPSVQSHTDLIFYKVNDPGDPNPDNGHQSVGNDDVVFYMNGSIPSLDTWKYSKKGSAHFAEFKVSSFSGGGGGFSENAQSSLPVALSSYQAKRVDNNAELFWTTESEIANDFFTLERSSDGVNFLEIGRVKGSGDAVTEKDYFFVDRDGRTGLNYYRLSQTDFDGTHVYLGVRVVDFDSNRKVNIFPNPLEGDLLKVDFGLEKDSNVKLVIRNIEGQMLLAQSYEISRGQEIVPVNMSDIGSGIYLVQIVGEGFSTTYKLIKD